MRPRVNAGALCSTGAASYALTRPLGIGSRFCLRADFFVFGGQSQSRFQIDGWFIRLRFDRQLRFAVARIRSVRETGKAE